MLSSSSAQLGAAAMFASSTCGSAQLVAGHATWQCMLITSCLCANPGRWLSCVGQHKGRPIRAHLKVSGHALGGGRQEQLGGVLDAARELLALCHVEHQVCLRLCTAILRSSACCSYPVSQVYASHDARSAGSLARHLRKHSCTAQTHAAKGVAVLLDPHRPVLELQAGQPHCGITLARAVKGALQGHHRLEDGSVGGAARHARGLDHTRKWHIGVLHGVLDDAFGASENLRESVRPCADSQGAFDRLSIYEQLFILPTCPPALMRKQNQRSTLTCSRT